MSSDSKVLTLQPRVDMATRFISNNLYHAARTMVLLQAGSTEKLSPQPHSSTTLGFLNLNAEAKPLVS